MKKNYEAPNFDIITYSLHEAIAANCDVMLYNNFSNGDDTCKDPDLAPYAFSDIESQCDDGPIITGYCYFTSTTNVVSTS